MSGIDRISLLLLLLISYCSVHAQLSDPLFVETGSLEKLDKINTSDSELSPRFYGDGFAFVLYKQKSKNDKPTRGEIVFDIMYQDHSMEEAVSLSDEINSSLVEGPFSVIDDEIYFTRTNSNISEDGKRRLKIYHAYQLENASWTKPQRIDFPEGDFNFCHPAVNQKGDVMIFASDLPGGFGKMDLYVSKENNGVWGRPINLGPEVNGPGNDWLPLLHGGKLYYGSDSYTFNGDIDLYEADFRDDYIVISSSPLAAPINSSEDEFGMDIHPDGKMIIFSSTRPGSKRDDLYLLTFETSLNKPEVPQSVSLDIELRDKHADMPISGAKLQLTTVDLEAYGLQEYDVKMILEKSDEVDHSTIFNLTTGEDGSQEIRVDAANKYVLRITKEGYKESRFFFDPSIDESSWLVMLEPLIIPTPKPEPVPIAPVIEEPIVIPTTKGEAIVFNNIYYEYNSDKIVKGGQSELDALANAMKDFPEMKVKLVAHTDAQGKDDYNLKLSERRAIAAKVYLQKKGIASDRIKTEGKGETQIRNHCLNNVTCDQEEHRFNRRTEVIILDN